MPSELDGVQFKTAQPLLDAYAQLDTRSTVDLAGTRGGKSLATMLYLH